jgi:hypothetical protein
MHRVPIAGDFKRRKEQNMPKRGKPPTRHNSFEKPKFWTLLVEPETNVVVCDQVRQCQAVLKNHGPEVIRVCPGSGPQFELWPGKLRVVDILYSLSLENHGEQSTLVEMSFAPLER